ncbi:hypothetical protein Nhal_4020 (plasmid) [Nitrosococcus halophilus Nc 4]|uniref:HNH nuclease domain-containing protein n=1 Tax=Nitrosococcus halophilus (strain Nc4) TaxID=472759 RepID=D5C5H4_NITHN|nr:HNH endonuclease signature motif containing protein [Nitrosococcus halophilus]ADE17028.1 hypothetical protein Nhal_4020 [Nitrosococcus halophilus Nc 4]
MRDRDIKILWGRSGNRCAICKLELTPDGTRETLGEMAHIVARSPDGPRGGESLPLEERDRYDNLILLCPTHHVEVDKAPDSWPTTRLRMTKQNHEAWVSTQLESGGISIPPIDNSEFLAQREQAWAEASRGQLAMVLSLTPLRVAGEVLDPLDEKVVATLESARVPRNGQGGEAVNRYRTRPTEHGISNEEFLEPVSAFGHSIQVFRAGHLEYFCELGGGVDQITRCAQERKANLGGANSVLRYTDIAEIADLGLTWLEQAWHGLLPFNDMTFSCMLVTTAHSTMYSGETKWRGGLFGHPVRVPTLRVSEVIARDFDREGILLYALRRLVNSYGLVLQEFKDAKGEYVRPERMR